MVANPGRGVGAAVRELLDDELVLQVVVNRDEIRQNVLRLARLLSPVPPVCVERQETNGFKIVAVELPKSPAYQD